jgi:peptidoglycan-associated lipoprotein
MNYIISQGVERIPPAGDGLARRDEPVVPTETEERRNRRTVTEVSGFVQTHPLVLDGEYARIVYRAYTGGGAE